MTRPTSGRPAARRGGRLLAPVAGLLLALLLSACSGGGGWPERDPDPSLGGGEPATLSLTSLETTLRAGVVSGRLPREARQRTLRASRARSSTAGSTRRTSGATTRAATSGTPSRASPRSARPQARADGHLMTNQADRRPHRRRAPRAPGRARRRARRGRSRRRRHGPGRASGSARPAASSGASSSGRGSCAHPHRRLAGLRLRRVRRECGVMRFPNALRLLTRRVLVLGVVLAVAALVVPASSVKSTEIELVKVRRASGVDVSPDVVWILAVGSDARPGEDMTRTPGRRAPAGRHEHREPARPPRSASPGTRTSASRATAPSKINAALYFGGPQLLGRTVGDLVGIQPDYVFVTRFPFFIAMVNDIGGIDVRNPRAFSDDATSSREGFERRPDPPRRVRRDGVLPDPAQPAGRRLRPLGQPAAGAARHPGQGPRPGPAAPASSSAACCR